MARKNSRSRWTWGWIGVFGIIIIVGLCVVTLGVLAYFQFRSQKAGGVLTANIRMPVTDQRVKLNQPLTILANANYPSGVNRVEVYADGALVLAKEASDIHEASLNLFGSWTPITTGRHVLLARGYASGALFADSHVVFVDVVDPPKSMIINVDNLPRPKGTGNPSIETLARGLGISPGELARLNPGLNGTSPSAPIPPGTRIEVPSPPASPHPATVQPPPAPGLPAPPTGLTGMGICGSSALSWTASTDARYYRVYRLGPGDTLPNRVADFI